MKPSFLALASFLLLATTSAQAAENVLRLYFEPTYPVRLDWQSPRALIESAVNAVIRNRSHPIGHVNVEVNCGERESPVLTGATGASAGVINQLLMVEQVGFSLLERGWTGRLESRANVLETFRVRGRDPQQLSVVTFELSRPACLRLKEFHARYVAETKPHHYGFAPRPRYREGAGCSAFAAAFVEVAGIMTPALRAAWTQERRIPLSLMAGHAGKTIVPISDLRSSPESARWALPGEPHMLLEFFDPDKMHEWAKRLAESPRALAALGGIPDTELPYGIVGVPAIRFNRSATPLPDEPAFLGRPRLAPKGKNSVVRTDVEFSRNGSFELRP